MSIPLGLRDGDPFSSDYRFYRAGIISIKMIAEKCDCTRQAIEKRAKVEGWTRNLQSCIPKVASRELHNATLEEMAQTQARPSAKQSAAPPYRLRACCACRRSRA